MFTNVQLQALGINTANIGFTTVTLESEKFICIREKLSETQNQVVIVDLDDIQNPIKRPITADSAIMHPTKRIIALKAGKQLQIFNIETKTKVKSYLLGEDVSYWRWIGQAELALVTEHSVFHWSIEGDSSPVRVFDRHSSLAGSQIISYKVDTNEKWMILVGIYAQQKKIAGSIQLFSTERGISQIIEGHCGAFGEVRLPTSPFPSKVFVFATRNPTTGVGKIHMVEIDHKEENPAYQKKSVDMFYCAEIPNDFPVALQVNSEYGIAYVMTKYGFLHLYDLECGSMIAMCRVSTDPIFVMTYQKSSGGIVAINRKGLVLSISVNTANIVDFLIKSMKNTPLALALAARCNFAGAEDLFVSRFNELITAENYHEAARVAAIAPNSVLRTPQTIEKLKFASVSQSNSPTIHPILQYFGTLLEKGSLNKFESIELSKPVLVQGKKQLLEKWLKEDRLDCSEELGDVIRQYDVALSLSVYLRANIPPKVVACFAELGQYSNIIAYCKKISFIPDYSSLLKSVLKIDPERGSEFAKLLLAENCLSAEALFECFASLSLVQQVTGLLLDILKQDLPEQDELQTKLLELQLATKPNVADAILENKFFTRYNHSHIAKLCEDAGLYQRALENYTETSDIKRVISGTSTIDSEWLCKFFGTLTPAQCLECVRDMLSQNLRSNMQLCVKIAVAYSDSVGANNFIELFENSKSFELLYSYLSSVISTSVEPEVHFKYIQAAYKTGQFKEIERVVRENDHYDPEKVKNFLKEVKLPDQIPLIIVCDRFGFVDDLITYLYQNNLTKFIEIYVQKVNSEKLPKVVAALLNMDAEESFVSSLIASVKGKYDMKELSRELEARNKLTILKMWLEFLTAKVKEDPNADYNPEWFNCLAKIYIDTGYSNVEQWLLENPHYNTLEVGKYCEKINPYLSYVCFERGQHDEELIELTNENSMFKQQARYMVHRRNPTLWNQVLSSTNEHRRSLIDQVIAVALPETQDAEEVSVTVKSFMDADLPGELIELLEKIVLENSTIFSENKNLQNLLILTAIKTSPERVSDYVMRLNNFDAGDIATVAIANGLYEDAFSIYNKYANHTKAISVLLDEMHDSKLAVEFAERVDEPEVWSKVAEFQLQEGLVKSAIELFLKADDFSLNKEVIAAAEEAECYSNLIVYLSSARKKIKDSNIENEFLFCLAKSDRLQELEEVVSTPNSIAQLSVVAERCYEQGLYNAAKLLYNSVSNYTKLANTLVKLGEYQSAVDCARKANNTKVWKEICDSCIRSNEYRLGQICALNLILIADELEHICQMYEKLGLFDQLITLLEGGIALERAQMGVFTELAMAYAKYREERLIDHIKKYSSKINISKLVKVVEQNHLWNELMLCYLYNEEFDLAVGVMMKHPVESFSHELFKTTITKITNMEVFYKALRFYLDEHPLLLNDILGVMGSRVDYSRVVQMFQKASHLPLIRQTLFCMPPVNNPTVNNALIELLIEEENCEDLHSFLERTESFDQLGLAAKLEKHSLMEMRKIAVLLWKRNKRYKQALVLSKRDKNYIECIEICAESKDQESCEELLEMFCSLSLPSFFALCLLVCYDWIRCDVVLEMGWSKGWTSLIMPFMCQSIRDLNTRVQSLEKELSDRFSIGSNGSADANQPQHEQGSLFKL